GSTVMNRALRFLERDSHMVAISVEPALHTIQNTCKILGCGRSTVYELIGKGRLDARKILTATRITDESIRALISSAPKAASQPVQCLVEAQKKARRRSRQASA